MTKRHSLILAFVCYLILAALNKFWLGDLAIVYAWLNFLFFCFLLLFGLKERVVSFFDLRAKSIGDATARAQKDFTDAQRAEGEGAAELAKLKEQQQIILDGVRLSAQNEALQIIGTAKQQAENTLIDAQKAVEQDTKRATQQIRRLIASQTTLLARHKISQRLTPQKHEQLGRDALARLKREVST